jgi:uncharacterized protein YjdB
MIQMKTKTVMKAIYIFLFACVMMAGCNKYDPIDIYDRNAPVKDIYLELSTLTMVEGSTYTITFWPLPANTDITKLSWTSSNPDVATVEWWGLVYAHKAGTATLTVSSGAVSKTVSLTVN